MEFKDYDDVVEKLVLPIRGKKYTLPTVSLEAGTKITLALAGEAPLGNLELRDLILGDLVQEFTTDHVPADAVGRAMLTGLAMFRHGRASAELIWETGGDPKALALFVSSQTATPSTSTDEVSTTKTQGSGTGTKTSRKTSSTAAKKSATSN